MSLRQHSFNFLVTNSLFDDVLLLSRSQYRANPFVLLVRGGIHKPLSVREKKKKRRKKRKRNKKMRKHTNEPFSERRDNVKKMFDSPLPAITVDVLLTIRILPRADRVEISRYMFRALTPSQRAPSDRRLGRVRPSQTYPFRRWRKHLDPIPPARCGYPGRSQGRRPAQAC